jgi:hypothetical protein
MQPVNGRLKLVNGLSGSEHKVVALTRWAHGTNAIAQLQDV